MISVSKLRRHPRYFHSFTGLSVSQFDQLLHEFQTVYETQKQQTLKNDGRQRKQGAGRPASLSLPDRLLMGLVYLRLYLSQRFVSFFFDIDQSNVCRELKERVLPALLCTLPIPLRDAPLRSLGKSDKPTAPPAKPGGEQRRRISTLQELLSTYPELSEVLLDATEQEIPQPENKQKRKETYSGKKQSHTVKTQVLATKKQILHVFGCLPGSVADVTLLGASGRTNRSRRIVLSTLSRSFVCSRAYRQRVSRNEEALPRQKYQATYQRETRAKSERT